MSTHWESNCTFCILIISPVSYYRPQRSCGKVMFLHLSVILFTEGVSVSVHAGISLLRVDTPRQTPPWADTPPCPVHSGIHPPCPVHAGIDMATTADGTHPTGMHSSCMLLFTFRTPRPLVNVVLMNVRDVMRPCINVLQIEIKSVLHLESFQGSRNVTHYSVI